MPGRSLKSPEVPDRDLIAGVLGKGWPLHQWVELTVAGSKYIVPAQLLPIGSHWKGGTC